jgi:hypothetical protein
MTLLQPQGYVQEKRIAEPRAPLARWQPKGPLLHHRRDPLIGAEPNPGALAMAKPDRARPEMNDLINQAWWEDLQRAANHDPIATDP